MADSANIKFTSTAPIGVSAGASFNYDVGAKKLKLTYSLLSVPAGMTIDAKTGLITWVIPKALALYWFQIVATNPEGDKAAQTVIHQACVPQQSWHLEMGMCMNM